MIIFFQLFVLFSLSLKVIPPKRWSANSGQLQDDYELREILTQEGVKLKKGGLDISNYVYDVKMTFKEYLIDGDRSCFVQRYENDSRKD